MQSHSEKPALTELPSAGGHRIAALCRPANPPPGLAAPLPTLLFIGGFNSAMTGDKATYLDEYAARHGLAYVRFDPFGHGQSTGRFEEGTISRWRDDLLLVIDRLTQGPLLLVGSSMGGWLMVLAALARPQRVAALVGIAAAPDFTEDTLLDGLPAANRQELLTTGRTLRPNRYGDPYPIRKTLIEDGRHHLVLRHMIPFDGPVRLLHGLADPDVPPERSRLLAARLTSTDLKLIEIADGDHRLSRPQDLVLLAATLDELVGKLTTLSPENAAW